VRPFFRKAIFLPCAYLFRSSLFLFESNIVYTNKKEKKLNKRKFKVQIPETDDDVLQGEEQFTIEYNGEKTRVRALDYDKIYAVPGLYEYLFYDKYKCKSPEVVCSLLEKEVNKTSMATSDLKVLDVGVGNGMVGEKLKSTGSVRTEPRCTIMR